MKKNVPILRFPERGGHRRARQVCFDRRELAEILNIYGRMVAAGIWRDYAIAAQPDFAVFAVYHRTSEVPAYSIVKEPARARKQGAFAIIGRDGQVVKRGHSLPQVLKTFQTRLLKIVG